MSLTEIRTVAAGKEPALAGHVRTFLDVESRRRRLETDGWSSDTMHPDFRKSSRPGDPPSHGQCGVSSAWLLQELWVDYGRSATYCYGDVLSASDSSTILARHCWVEIGTRDAPDRIVIDVTSDQVSTLNGAVLCAPHDELIRTQAVNYAARERFTFAQLPQNPVWERFIRLKTALGEDIEDLPSCVESMS